MARAKKKVCVVVNSRANYGRIKSAMEAIKNHPHLDLQLIVGASALLYRYGNAIDIIQKDGFACDAKLYSIVEGETPVTMAKSTGLAITELSTLFENLKPDIVVTVADRFETLATAVAASYMNITLAHTQGGEVTGSIDESVRHAITKLSHIHFPATENSGRILEKLGEDPDAIHIVGCPSIDAICNLDFALQTDIFEDRGVGPPIDQDQPYLVVLQHPVTTEYGDGFLQIEETLKAVVNIGLQTVWLWPNVDAGSDDISKGLRMYREREKREDKISFFRNFEPENYARLIFNCACLIGNSSSALREGGYLGVPAVNIGTRQNLREHSGNVLFSNYSSSDIEEKIRYQINNGKYEPSNLYGDGKSGERIADILARTDVNIQKRLHFE